MITAYYATLLYEFTTYGYAHIIEYQTNAALCRAVQSA